MSQVSVVALVWNNDVETRACKSMCVSMLSTSMSRSVRPGRAGPRPCVFKSVRPVRARLHRMRAHGKRSCIGMEQRYRNTCVQINVWPNVVQVHVQIRPPRAGPLTGMEQRSRNTRMQINVARLRAMRLPPGELPEPRLRAMRLPPGGLPEPRRGLEP